MSFLFIHIHLVKLTDDLYVVKVILNKRKVRLNCNGGKTMEGTSNNSLYTLIAVLVFGIFLSLSYWLFQDELKSTLASVMDKSSETTSIKLANDGLYATSEAYFTINEDGVILDYTGYSLDVIVPDIINGIVVKELGVRSLSDKGLTTLKLPNSIVKIGPYALSNNKLTSVILPANLEDLGIYALLGNHLETIELPSTLTKINEAALAHNSLISLTIPSSVVYIGDRAIVGNKLKRLTIPTSVTHLGLGVLRDNAYLEDFKLPLSLHDDVLADQRLLGSTFDTDWNYLTFYDEDVVSYY